jgi:transcriptional regulator with XRE-family HTH domain
MENPLKKIRQEYNLTKVEMAAILDTTPATYSIYERGEAFPSKKKLKLLADFLELDYEKLAEEFAKWKCYLTQKRREEALKKVKAKVKSSRKKNLQSR